MPGGSKNPAWEGARSNLLEKSWSKRSAWWHRTCWLGAPLRLNLSKPQKGEPDFTFIHSTVQSSSAFARLSKEPAESRTPS